MSSELALWLAQATFETIDRDWYLPNGVPRLVSLCKKVGLLWALDKFGENAFEFEILERWGERGEPGP